MMIGINLTYLKREKKRERLLSSTQALSLLSKIRMLQAQLSLHDPHQRKMRPSQADQIIHFVETVLFPNSVIRQSILCSRFAEPL